LKTILKMENIVKRFPGVLANDRVNLDIKEGEIHGLLGENGAGKTTLMNILSGLSSPDDGEIWFKGRSVRFSNCHDAIDCGIGMVHQHFMLVPVFTVAENIVLGNEPVNKFRLDTGEAEKLVSTLSERYQLKVDPKALIQNVSVGMQQRVEILKALSRGADILILDEPTAVLTPQEVDELYIIMRALREEGHTIIFITHKLGEIKEITDSVTVLRDGRNMATCETKDVDEEDLARMMVGRDVILHVVKPDLDAGEITLSVENVSAVDTKGLPALKNISFNLREGEIVGIAGVAGNGQTELVEVLTGLRPVNSGHVFLKGKDITHCTTRERMYQRLAHIPEDRQRRGLVMQFTLLENFLLGYEDTKHYIRGPFLNFKAIQEFASTITKFDVRAPNLEVLAHTLSGGNQQKLIVAREIQRNPTVLIASQPTRGLDVAATEFVHNQLIDLRGKKTSILLVSMELSEILDLSDRIMVMYAGEIVGSFEVGKVTVEQLGLLMAGSSIVVDDQLNTKPF
jgi:general nucleoside transport system ATP-binding protein